MTITISQFAQAGKRKESQPPPPPHDQKDQKAPQLHPAPKRPPDVVPFTRVLKPLAIAR